MARRIGSLIVKEFKQLRRDPILVILIIWLYTIEVIICAYALSFDLRDITLAVVDRDKTPESRRLTEQLDRSRDFRVIRPGLRGGKPSELLDREEALAVLTIPSGWTRSMVRGEEAPLQLLVDGSNSAIAAAVRGYALRMLQQFGTEAVGRGNMSVIQFPTVENRTRIWYNAELKYVYFMVLSMIALAGMMVGVIHPAAVIVREKETGTIDQLLVSPIRSAELVLAKVLPTLVVGLVGLTLSIGVVLWFDLPMRGSLFLFFFISIIFMFSSMGIGVFVATVSKNLQQALLLSFFGLFPVMFLSGTIVPVESMPRPFQIASLASPLRYYMQCLLGLFLKGNGLDILWPQVVIMAVIAFLIVGLSLRRLRRQIA
jgi:ABC-2 type transport system permease protein